MPSCFDVADYFLHMQREDVGDCISSLYLQKLCYYAQGFTLAVTGEPLFPEEIKAWSSGPVIRELHSLYEDCLAACIQKPKRKLTSVQKCFSWEQQEILNDVYVTYGQFAAWRLRAFIHNGPPWRDTFDNNVYGTDVISHSKMAEFFKTRLISDEGKDRPRLLHGKRH